MPGSTLIFQWSYSPSGRDRRPFFPETIAERALPYRLLRVERVLAVEQEVALVVEDAIRFHETQEAQLTEHFLLGGA